MRVITAFLTVTILSAASAFAADPLVSEAASTGKIAWTDTICAGHVVSIDALNNNVGAEGGVLYKSENIHGGRGPTFLVQKVSERTNKTRLEIRNARCEVIGAVGLFATDQPYGSRYYSRTGGSGHDGIDLLNEAQLVGSNNILVEGINGQWILVHNPLERDGNIRK